MAILTKSRGPAAHWYTPDGNPKHQIERADGSGMRPTTLRDARQWMLVPSVTTILRIIDKPQLTRWRMQQAALSASRNPRQPTEPEDYWLKRVLDGAETVTEQAADLGSKIHDALEAATAGEDYDHDLDTYIVPVLNWYEENGIVIGKREIVVVDHEGGFAGRVDVLFKQSRRYGVLDYKTRKTTPGKTVLPYDGQGMQLAAYAKAYYGRRRLPRIKAINLFISTTEPGRIETYEHPDLLSEYEAFTAAAHLWRHTNGYDPRSQ